MKIPSAQLAQTMGYESWPCMLCILCKAGVEMIADFICTYCKTGTALGFGGPPHGPFGSGCTGIRM